MNLEDYDAPKFHGEKGFSYALLKFRQYFTFSLRRDRICSETVQHSSGGKRVGPAGLFKHSATPSAANTGRYVREEVLCNNYCLQRECLHRSTIYARIFDLIWVAGSFVSRNERHDRAECNSSTF